ncbi:MAG: amidohydrolase [Candidatus Asgardarchaeum sp.]
MVKLDKVQKEVVKGIESRKDFIIKTSNQIYEYAEPSLQEYKSSHLLKEAFKENGFKIEPVKDQPTAFIATWGEGKPVIATYGECDALEGESQDQVPYRKPLPGKAGGFMDMHNGLGAASMGAILAVKEVMEKYKIKGTIKYFLTPAEKMSIGKPYMARDGYFEGLDALLGWHPGHTTMAEWGLEVLACQEEEYSFYGLNSWGGRPHAGRSALDAVLLMINNVEYTKEHLFPHEANLTISSVITNGGENTSSISSFAKVYFVMRALKREYVDKIIKKLEDCAEAACKVTGCTYKKRVISGTWHAVYNHTLVNLIYRNIKRIGAPKFTQADRDYMNEIFKNLGLEKKDEPWDTKIVPPTGERKPSAVDDHSEFCYFCPTCRFYVNYLPGDSNTNFDIPNWCGAALAAMHVGYESEITAAKILSSSIVELLMSPEVLKEAKNEFEKAGLRKMWKSPIPANVKPLIGEPLDK